MTYIVNGLGNVGVEISRQAVRPREPARPQPAITVASPMMATRQARPRATVQQTGVTKNALAQVAALKGKQSQLEKLLKMLGVQLKQCRAYVASLQAMPTPTGSSTAALAAAAVKVAKLAAGQKSCLMLEKAIIECINAIKACAGKANLAADAAIATGASETQVKQAAVVASPSSAKETVVESSTATVTPSGQIVPGPDAVVVATPVLTEAVEPSTPPGVDVSPPSTEAVIAEAEEAVGGIPWVKVGLALGLGYLIFRKR